jgi:alpha-beta hydrolase superfamily lysophospholipase
MKMNIFGKKTKVLENMRKQEFYINSYDNTRLFASKWIVEKKPKANIIIVHGFSEHSGRYQDWIKKFNKEGYNVYALDYRGHGKSKGKRGHIKKYKELIDDLESLLFQIPEDNTPNILYGQSMGGNIVLNYGLMNPQRVKGIIATSPWLKLSKEPKSLALLIVRILRKIFPGVTRNSVLDINCLSHDKRVIEAFNNDPLTHQNITASLFFEVRKAGYFAIDHASSLEIPTLIMHGTKDMVTSFTASKEFAYNAKSAGKDLQFIPWNNLYHELHHEFEKDKVFSAILKWLESKQ